MKTFKVVLGVATVALIVMLSTIRPRREQSTAYNPAGEILAKGVVQDVQEYYCPVSGEQGTHLVLKTEDGGVLVVHAGPARFLRSIQAAFNKGDQIEVIGSKLKYMGSDAVLAREVRRGDEMFLLRDREGKPVWLR